MAKAVMETAAEKYAALKEAQFEAFLEASFSAESLKGVDLFEVKTPVGMVFKCRKIDMTYLQNAGQLPMALSAHVMTLPDSNRAEMSDEEKQAADEESFRKMSPMERRASIQASTQIVRYICVEPRLIAGEANGHKNAISFGALTMADFTYLSKWASGGDAASGLKTFRSKRK